MNRLEKLFIRVYTGSRFLKEIDGLRFVAICSVLIFHIAGYIRKNSNEGLAYVNYDTWWGNMFHNASNGVELFFCISGFILALPMLEAPDGLLKKEFLQKYFKRRITRLEPPYLLVMIFLVLILLASGKVLDINPISSFLASFVYLHNVIFEKPSVINVVAWSLEVEFQFYILAPVLVYLISKTNKRILVLLVAIVALALLHLVGTTSILTIASFLHFFLIGILLADMYLQKEKYTIGSNSFMWNLVWLLALVGVLNINFRAGGIENLLLTTAIFFLVYSSLFVETIFRRMLQMPSFYLIGGMCYSIYLIHYPVIGFVGKFLDWNGARILISLGLLLLAISATSSILFLLVEKPAMIRDWYKKGVKEVYKTVFGINS